MLAFHAATEQPEYRATADLERGASVSMIVTPMFGVHSDWERQLEVGDGNTMLTRDLFEDTGWWRGSSLYRHPSGVLILIEGQLGCLQFELSPPRSVRRPSIDCSKTGTGRTTSRDDPPGVSPPVSAYYRDVTYLGTFDEARSADGSPIAFVPYTARSEPELLGPF